jgi:transposase
MQLMTVPGIAPIISSATVAGIGKGDVFGKGRDLAAWLGLLPKQTSTGGRAILGRISKRGNRYLRQLFVQAARGVLARPQSWERCGLKHWIEAADQRLHYNKRAVAFANKRAHIAWAVVDYGRTFEMRSEADHVPQSPLSLAAAASAHDRDEGRTEEGTGQKQIHGVIRR